MLEVIHEDGKMYVVIDGQKHEARVAGEHIEVIEPISIADSEQTPPPPQPSEKAEAFMMSTTMDIVYEVEAQGQVTGIRMLDGSLPFDEAVYTTALGLSDEQIALLDAKEVELTERMDAVIPRIEERLNRFDELSPEEVADLGREFRTTVHGFVAESQATFDTVLTPEQKQRALELELVLPSLSSQAFSEDNDDEDLIPLHPTAYEALGMSDEQKAGLTKLQEESGKELKDLMKLGFQHEQEEGKVPPELVSKIKTLKTQIRAKILSVLSEEQRAKLEKICTDWPKKLEQIKADRNAKHEKKKPEDEAWKPDENSWKPGDPVPEGAVPPRVRKPFPF